MAMAIEKLRKLVAIDKEDPLSLFALGQALFQDGGPESPSEAANHLIAANTKAPEHLATYHILAQVLIKLDRNEEARTVLTTGCERVAEIGGGMGKDLGPAMVEMLKTL